MSNLLIRQFWRLERAAPAVRLAIWRQFYNAIALLLPDRQHHFMNWGYLALLPEEATRPVNAPTPLQRNMIGLYAHTLGDVKLKNKRVLEVGSGRGGGAAWIARTQAPASMLGIELAPAAVRLATEAHAGAKNLQFAQGNALALGLADESMDVVVNVESCHHYASMAVFLHEVQRVLVPGGHLCLSDYREAHELPALEAELAACGLRVVRARDITANVVAALDADNAAKEDLLTAHVAWPLRGIMRTFFGNRGTDVHTSFATRKWVYLSWVLRKPLAHS